MSVTSSRSASGHTAGSHGRYGHVRHKAFTFATGNLVLVKWDDGMVYFAKIKRIDQKKGKCIVVFDDKSQDEASFSQIHSVDETTTDIICIKCKKDDSDLPNEIVLCDMCGIGFHQKCHSPTIPVSALQLDIPWNCSYCQRGVKCPFLTESLDVLQNLLSDDNESTTCDEEEDMDSEMDGVSLDESSSGQGGLLRKRKGKKSSALRNAKRERRKSLRSSAPVTPELSSLVTVERKTRSITHANEVKEASPARTPITPDARSPSNDSPELATTESMSGRKRKKHTNLFQKRAKRSSVESRTVSVTRIDTPIYADSSTSNLFLPLVEEPTTPSSKEPSPISSFSEPENKDVFVETDLTKESPTKLKQRRFCVSLSLPDDADKTNENSSVIDRTPSWDLLTSLISPKKASVDKNKSITNESSKEQHNKDGAKEHDHVHAPFLASPLPNVSLGQLGVTTKPTISMDVGVSDAKIKSPTIVANSVVIASTKIPQPTPLAQSVSTKCVVKPVDPLQVQPSTPNFSKEEKKDEPEEMSKKGIQSPLAANSDTNKTPSPQPNAAATNLSQPQRVVEIKVVKKGVQSTTSTTDPNFRKEVQSVTVKKSVQPVKQAPAISCSSDTDSELQIFAKSPESSKEVNLETVKVSPVIDPVSNKVLDKTDSRLQSSKETPLGSDSKKVLNPEIEFSTKISDSSKIQQGETKQDDSPVISPYSSQEQKQKSNHPPDFSEAKKQSSPKGLKHSTTICPDSSKPERAKEIVLPPKKDKEETVPYPIKPKRKDVGLIPIKPKLGHVTMLGIQPPQHSIMNSLKVIKSRPTVLPFEKQASSSTPDMSSSSTRTPVITTTSLHVRPHQDHLLEKKQVTNSVPPAEASSSLTGSRKSVLHTAHGSSSKSSSPASLVTSSPSSPPSSSPSPSVTSSNPDLDVIITGIETCDEARKLTPNSRDARQKKKAVDTWTSPQVEQFRAFHKTTTPVAAADKIVCTRPPQPPPPPPPQMLAEPVCTPASTKIRSEDASPLTHSVGTAAVYHSPDPVVVKKSGSHLSNVTKTKPYAIVNALPVQSADVGYRPINQKSSGSKQQHLVQMVSSTGVVQLVAKDVFQDSPNASETVSSVHPPPTYSMFVADNKKNTIDDDVQSIQKKIGDAFSCSSETMLVSAFEEAWGKFQANGKKYSKQKSKGNFPNHREIVQQISTKPRLAAPKPSVKSSATPVNSPPQYIHATAVTPTGPSGSQKHLVFRSIPQEHDTVYAGTAGPGSSHQVHQAGLFYPTAVEVGAPGSSHQQVQAALFYPAAVDVSGPPEHSIRPKQPLQQQQRVITKVSSHTKVHGQQNQQVKVLTKPAGSQGKVVRKSTKQCARCGDNATFLCSGCEVEWYCGRDCQLKAWEVHADHCKA